MGQITKVRLGRCVSVELGLGRPRAPQALQPALCDQCHIPPVVRHLGWRGQDG
jgi:hypothetical protein